MARDRCLGRVLWPTFVRLRPNPMDAQEAHETMSTQALDSEDLREGPKDILLGPAKLYEMLRGELGGAA